ncbi:MAG TPA: glycosyltransferase family 1 protein [Bacteroidia bacterium]|nr:glycosyltransferase family 1 protein [Bacteroidia bacterium]
MKIGFDAKRAFNNKSGLGNYSRNLIKGIVKNNPREDYFLFNSEDSRFKLQDFLEKKSNIHMVQPKSFWAKEFPGWWRSYGITKDSNQLQLDIYHGLSNEIPLNCNLMKAKKIVTIHDLIFMRHPEFYNSADRKVYTVKTKKSCSLADAVVAVSNQTKNDLIELLQVPKEKIHVVYQTCDENFFHEIQYETNNHSPEKYLPDNYILYVGTIEQRKNLLALVKAIHELDKTMQVTLVVVGKETNYNKEVSAYVERYGLEKRVIFMKSINNALMPLIYRKAKAFVYPSLYEGFGIPILEALVSKVPVITTRGGCFHESAGPGSIFVDPDNAEELADAIRLVLSDETKRKQMIETGYQYAQQFKPEICADNMFNLYKKICEQ